MSKTKNKKGLKIALYSNEDLGITKPGGNNRELYKSITRKKKRSEIN